MELDQEHEKSYHEVFNIKNLDELSNCVQKYIELFFNCP